MKENKMREVEIEKMIIHAGGIENKLEKSIKLLEMTTKRKVYITKAKKRIPTFGISPGKKSGCKVTIRNKEEVISLLKRFFAAIDNKIKQKQICKNHVSFGIKEYIEVPGLEYNRDIGILGFEVDLVFARKGKRVKYKKIKRGKYPKRQDVNPEEIVSYLSKNLKVEVEK
ncbi:MAG: 50S ribosomal protein L5 [Candidatus Pacearchaeota archaeon]